MLTNSMLSERTGLTLMQFVMKGATDFKFWAESLFKYDIQPFHLEWVNAFYNNKRTSIQAHRGSGKSTILGEIFVLWMMFYEKNKNFMVVSPTMAKSTEIIRNVRRHINDIEILRSLRPSDRSKTWTKTEINTTTGCKLVSRPYSEYARGFHCHYMLMDEASQFKDLLIYERVFLPMLGHHDGNLMIIGTPSTDIDLLARASLPNSGFKHLKYPAIINNTPLWKNKFPMEKLDRLRKELGELSFAREYLCELRGEKEQSISREDILRALDTEMRLVNAGDEGVDYFMGVDLAMSAEGDYSVYSIVEKTKENRIVLRHMRRLRGMDFKPQAGIISGIYKKFRPRKILIDDSQFGSGLIQVLRQEYGVPAKAFRFEPRNRNIMIGNLINLFKEGRIDIPRDLDHPETMSITDEIIEEVSGIYPSRTKSGMETYNTVSHYDDCIMSLGLACYAANSVRSRAEMIILSE